MTRRMPQTEWEAKATGVKRSKPITGVSNSIAGVRRCDVTAKAKWSVLTYIAAHNNLVELGKQSRERILGVGSTSDVVHGMLYDGSLGAARYVVGSAGTVDGGRGKGFGHELVEAGGVQVRADREGAFFVGCIHDPVEALGGVGGHGQQANVIDHHEFGAEDSGDRTGDAVIDAVGPDQGSEVLEPEPRHAHPGFDGLLAEGFEEERFTGPGRPADDEVFPRGDPFQRP